MWAGNRSANLPGTVPHLPSISAHLRPPISAHLRPNSAHLRPNSAHLPPISAHLRPNSAHLPSISAHLPPISWFNVLGFVLIITSALNHPGTLPQASRGPVNRFFIKHTESTRCP